MTTWDFIQAIASAATVPLTIALAAMIFHRQRNALKPEVKAKLSSMGWHYTWGCFASGLNGAAVAMLSFVGVSVGAGQSPQTVQSPNTAMLSYVFGTTFVLKALEYFTRNPLPVTLDTSTPPFSVDAKIANK